MYYHFKECGCKIPILSNSTKECDGLQSLEIDFEKVPLDCPITWDLISTGRTKGVFQLESQLGQSWAKKLEPHSIEEMAALSALLRPSCLRAISEGKSLTQHFVDRKHNTEPTEAFHAAIADILRETYQILVYQEQSMQIVQKIGQFDLIEADILRRGIGHKDPATIAKVGKLFKEKAAAAGLVTEAEAEEIWSWIKRGERYAFNKCLSPNTIVETENGLKTLEEINIGDKIKIPLDNEYSEVLDKIDQGIQDVYEITLESGKTIQCTLEHKFLCKDGQIRPLFEILQEQHEIICDDD